MKLKTKLPETDLADFLTGIGALTHASYRSVLAALGREEQDLPPHDLPGDLAGVHLSLWGPESISLPAAVQRELARLTRSWISDRESEQLLREVAARQEGAEEQRRKEHVDRFIAEELEFSYRGRPLPDADVSACYRDWCGRTGESPLDDITSRIPSSVTKSFRSWVPPAERMLRDSRIREFLSECTGPNHFPVESGVPLDEIRVAYAAWSGVEAPENFRGLLDAVGKAPISTTSGYRVHVSLREQGLWGPAKPPKEIPMSSPSDPCAISQGTPGATWSPRLGRWVPAGHQETVERQRTAAFEALQKLVKSEDQRIAEAQRKFDEEHPPQPDTDPTQSRMFAGSYSQPLNH